MKKVYLYIIPLLAFLISVGFIEWKSKSIEDNSRVSVLLDLFGEQQKSHFIKNIDPEKAQIGHDLVHNGYATLKGKKSKIISKFFVCTDCHNTVREDADLTHPNAKERLSYSKKHGIPILQGTTLYGAVNRESWYNQDYKIKYGNLVTNARDTLENSIQLCAEVCSQGRTLEIWELESMLHYFNQIDYKVSDLDLSENEKTTITTDSIKNELKTAILKSKYSSFSPATFLNIQTSKTREFGAKGNPINGKHIYIKSCLHCHGYDKEITGLQLDTNSISLSFLGRNLQKNNKYSIYNIVRKGTHASVGMRAYMPMYTKEKMSEQQLEDLASYILNK